MRHKQKTPATTERSGLRDRIYSLGETLSVAISRPGGRPGRFSRVFFKFPVWLQRFGMYRWMGNSLVILTTTGRKSGLPRQTALSNFGHDPANGTYYVVSGFGRQSDWLRNVQANPAVHLKVGRVEFDGVAEEVPKPHALRLLSDYLRRYPSVGRTWGRRIGVSYDGSDASLRALAGSIAVLAIRPLHSSLDV